MRDKNIESHLAALNAANEAIICVFDDLQLIVKNGLSFKKDGKLDKKTSERVHNILKKSSVYVKFRLTMDSYSWADFIKINPHWTDTNGICHYFTLEAYLSCTQNTQKVYPELDKTIHRLYSYEEFMVLRSELAHTRLRYKELAEKANIVKRYSDTLARNLGM